MNNITMNLMAYAPVKGFGPECTQGVEGHTYEVFYSDETKETLEIKRTDRCQFFEWIAKGFKALYNALRKLVGLESKTTARDEVRKTLQTAVDFDPIVKALQAAQSKAVLITIGSRDELEVQAGKQAECAFPPKSFVFKHVDPLKTTGDSDFMFEGSGGEIKFDLQILTKRIETKKFSPDDVKSLALVQDSKHLTNIYEIIKNLDITTKAKHELYCAMAENSALSAHCINDLITMYAQGSKSEPFALEQQCALYEKLAGNSSTSVEDAGRIVDFVKDSSDEIATDNLQKVLIEKGSLSPDSIRTLFSIATTEPEWVGKLHFWNVGAKKQAQEEMQQKRLDFVTPLVRNQNLPANSIEALYAGLIGHKESELFNVYKNISVPEDRIDFPGFSNAERLDLGAPLAGHSNTPKNLFDALFDTVIDRKATNRRLNYLAFMMRSPHMSKEQAKVCIDRGGVMPPAYKQLLLAPGEGKDAFKFNQRHCGTDAKEINRLVEYLEVNGSSLNLNSREEREQAAEDILRNVSFYCRPESAWFSSTAPLTDSIIKDIGQHDFHMLGSMIEGPAIKYNLMDDILAAIDSDGLMEKGLKAELLAHLLYRYAVKGKQQALHSSDPGVKKILSAVGQLPTRQLMDDALSIMREKGLSDHNYARLAVLLPSNKVV